MIARLKKISWKVLLITLFLLVGSIFLTLQIKKYQQLKLSDRQLINPQVESYRKNLPTLKQKALANPDDYQANNDYAQAVYTLNAFTEAETALSKVIKLRQTDSVAHNQLGNVYSSQDKYQQAETAYLQSINLNPNQVNAYINLANLYINNLKDKTQGYQVYDQALERNPGNVNIMLMYAAACKRQGDTSKAKDIYNQVLQIDSSNQTAVNALSKL